MVMATLEIFIMITTFFIFVFFLPHIAVASCPISVCNSSNPNPNIRFPFRLSSQSPSCGGFPGFHLSCNSQKQTIISLPSSGDFSVDSINYLEQTLFINDLDKCLTKRFFENDFSLAGTPFSLRFDALDEFTFLNSCSSTNTVPEDIPPVSCLGDDFVSYMAIAVPISAIMPPDYYGCSVISRAFAPKYLDRGVELAWNEPNLSFAEGNGLLRELEHGKSPEIQYRYKYYSTETGDLSTSKSVGLVLTVGFVILLFIFICRCHWYNPPGELTITEPSTIATGEMQLPVAGRALDRQTIESYPKFQLGETLELVEPDNKSCPICLCDYQAKEILRTIPECNHYFHADCIDAWLRKNPTCPICRNVQKSSVTEEHVCYSVMHATCPHSWSQSPTPTSHSNIHNYN